MAPKNQYIPIIALLLLYFVIGFYRLDALPGEWFGDISNEHEYVSDILAGKWPWDFMQSTGPLYHYLITPIIWILGPSYLSYKIASVLIGGVGVVGIYLMAKEFAGTRVALFSGFATVLSFWYIVIARLGSSPQMLSPVLVAWALFFLLRFQQQGKAIDGAMGVVICGLGFITYPALFVLPIVGVLLWLYAEKKIGKENRKIRWIGFFIAVELSLFFFLLTFVRASYADTREYITNKLIVRTPWVQSFATTGTYVIKTLGSLHARGDQIFRVNIPGRPHLDVASGGLFLLGLIVLFTRYRKKVIFIIIPLLLLPIPSILPTAPTGEVPSSGRTLGMTPVVFLLVGLGLEALQSNLNRFKLLKLVIVPLVLLGISWINLVSYFRDYPKVLPEQNSPFGRMIAEYIDTLPSTTVVRLTDCCWGKAGIPEPKAIYYSLKNPQTHQNIIRDPFIKTCEEVPNDRPLLLIFNPSDTEKIEVFRSCYGKVSGEMHKNVIGQEVFYSLFIDSF